MLLSPSLYKFKWLTIGLLLLLLNLLALWLWANFLTLRYQRYLMYLGYLPVDSRSRVLMPQIRPPFQGIEDSLEQQQQQSSFENMVEEFYIKSRDGTLLHVHFYKFPSKGRYSFVRDVVKSRNKTKTKNQSSASSVPTVLFFHGTSGNIGHRVGYAHTLSSICQCNVMLINCRGYGLSEGHAHSKGIREDSQAALNFLLNRPVSDKIDVNKIFVLGQSMGGAIAIDLAMRNLGKIKGMIIDNTFTRINDLVPEVLPPFSHLRDYLTEDWDSLGAIEAASGNDQFPHALFLIGDRDELINSKNGKRLYQAAVNSSNSKDSNNRKEVKMLLFKYGYHVHTFRDPFYFDSIAQFINEVSSK